MNPGKQYQANTAGITAIATLVHRCAVVERIYHEQALSTASSQPPGDMAKLKEDLINGLAKLYCQILEYQARSVCQLSRSKIVRLARDAVTWDSWDSLLSDIRASELEVEKAQSVLDTDALQRGFETQELRTKQLFDVISGAYGKLQQMTDKALTLAENMAERLVTADELRCLEAFQNTEFDYEAAKNRNADRLEGTCEWFLRHPKYCEWMDSECSNLLLVTADPGCGKSVLSKFLIDSGKLSEGPRSSTVCYFFFKNENSYTSSATQALSAILHQLFCQRKDLLPYALTHFSKSGGKLSGQSEKLWTIFMSATNAPEAGNIICIFDALDECSEDTRGPFIKKLSTFYKTSGSNTSLKTILTSRPYDRIRDAFFLAGLDPQAVLLAGENDAERDEISREVDLVVQSRVADFKKLRFWKTKEEDDAHTVIIQHLSTITNRTYLWVSLIFPELEKHAATAKNDLLRMLISLPRTINDAYEKILSQSLDEVQARKLLHIIAAAARPLSLDEMNIALTVRDEPYELKPRVSFPTLLRELCGLFVHVVDQKIYLFHQSAKDFLLPPPPDSLPAAMPGPWQHSLKPEQSNRILAFACIWYLQEQGFNDEPHIIEDRLLYQNNFPRPYGDEVQNALEYLDRHCFLEYASHHWATHYRAASPDEVLLNSSIKICEIHSNTWKTWFGFYLFERSLWEKYRRSWFPKSGNELLLRSYFGHTDAARMILEGRSQPGFFSWVSKDALDSENDTLALEKACEQDRQDIIRILVEHGISIHYKALDVAIGADNVSMTRLLFGLGADRDLLYSKERRGNRDSLEADIVFSKNLELAEVLLGKGADLYIVLFKAIEWGKVDIIRLLVEDSFSTKGAPNAPDPSFKGPVSASNHIKRRQFNGKELDLRRNIGGNLSMMQRFSGKELNLGRKIMGGSPMMLAVNKGKLEIARYLSHFGPNPNEVDEKNQTLLHSAVQNPYRDGLALTRLCIEIGVPLDWRDEYGRTATHLAINSGRESWIDCNVLVNLLKEGANVNVKDKHGLTALHYAAWALSIEAVKICLEYGANPLETTNAGDTILHLIVRSAMKDSDDDTFGDDEGMFIYLKFCLNLGVDVRIKNSKGRTAIDELSIRRPIYHNSPLFDDVGLSKHVRRMDSLELLRRRMASVSHEEIGDAEEEKKPDKAEKIRELLLAKQKEAESSALPSTPPSEDNSESPTD